MGKKQSVFIDFNRPGLPLISIKFPAFMSMLLTNRRMTSKGIMAGSMSKKKDKELLEELEALGETIEWLEQRSQCDFEHVSKSVVVKEQELKEWLRSPSLNHARSWLKK